MEYRVLWSAVKQALDSWNPYGISVAEGEDDYDYDSAIISCSMSGYETAEEICSLLVYAFNRHGFRPFTQEECLPVAEAIHTALQNAGR